MVKDMIKKLAIVLFSSLLLVGSMGETAEAAHGIWPFDCPGNYRTMGESNISSWRYTHTEDFDGDRVSCSVFGWTERVCDYCSTCGDKKNIKITHRESHTNPVYSYTVKVAR